MMSAADAPDKGGELEEALRAYFWRAGYFVVRGVPYILDGDDVTDIDLWLYERPAASTRRRIIVDIKNKKSPKAAERVIWVKGLLAALSVDQAIVATTDKRASTRRLAKQLNIILLDGDAISKISKSEKLKDNGQLRIDEIESSAKSIDQERRTAEWRREYCESLSSLVFGFGVQSANRCLRATGFFLEQAIDAHPRSAQAEVAVRLAYRSAALAAVSLDYFMADLSFKQPEERRKSIVSSIRFGESDSVSAVSTINAAIHLARRYANAGAATAKQIEYGFFNDADRIPAEIIADLIVKMPSFDMLFMVARELDTASLSRNLPGFDDLSLTAKSLLGAFADFNSQSRERFASAWPNENDAENRQIRLHLK